MITFKIGSISTEYGYYIIMDTYEVNTAPVTESWTDADHVEHRVHLRSSKVKGDFDMLFPDMPKYYEFESAIQANTSTLNGTVPLTLSVNNTLQTVTGNFFVEFNPVRTQSMSLKENMLKFTVYIEEA